MRTLLGSLGIIAALTPAGAWASSNAVLERCKNEMTAPVMLPSQVLERELGVKIENACPEQSSKDTNKNCENIAKDLEKAAKNWLAAHKESCKLKQAYADLNASNQNCTGATNNCSAKAAELQKKANAQNEQELSALRKMREKAKELKEFALNVAQGAVNYQKEAEDDARANPTGSNGRHNRWLKVRNNQQAVEYFTRTGQTVQAGQQIIDALRNSDVSSGNANQRPQSPLLREPIDIAATAQRLDNDFSTRERELVASSNELNRQITTNTSKENSMTSLGNNASSVGQAASAAAGAGAGTGAGVGGSTGSGTESLVGSGTTPSGSTAGNEQVLTVVQDADGTERYAMVPRSALPGYNALNTASSKNSATPSSTGINNLAAVAPATPSGEAGATTTSGSSRAAPSSNLRNALRARLAGAGGAGSAGAGMAEGGAAGSLGEMAKTAEAVSPAAPGVESKADALAAATGTGDLGTADFSLAGSETDSFVQGMVSQFSEDLGLAGHRGLASVAQGAPEILEQDSASLFLRARATHERSLKRGLVINGLRSKL